MKQNLKPTAIKLLQLFRDLLVILQKEGDSETRYAIKQIGYGVNLLEQSVNKTENELKGALHKIKTIHKSIYPPHGGLSDFFIWRDDFDERQKLNIPFEELKDELRTIIEDMNLP